MNSYHYATERQKREQIIKSVIGEGKIIKVVKLTEKNYGKGGLTIHKISDTGILTIFTPDGKIITKKILRPSQLYKYFSKEEITENYQELLKLCIKHKREHLNEF